MVKMTQKNDRDFIDFCRRDVFGTRISCLFQCYSTDYDFVKFWVQTNEKNEIIAAISRIEGDVTLCTTGDELEETAQFLTAVGFRTIQCEKNAAKKMGMTSSIDGYVVEYKKNNGKIAEIHADSSFRPKEIYDIIKEAALIGVGDYLPWLSDTVFRINRGFTSALTADVDGETAACAMKLFSTDSAVLLGAVATKPKYRGRGLAGALVTALAESENGKRIELLCKNDSIVNFYKSIGFNVKNEWSIINEQ